MQTILGAGGAIGKPLAKELSRFTDRIRLVSRNPKKVNVSDELYPADISNTQQIDGIVQELDRMYGYSSVTSSK